MVHRKMFNKLSRVFLLMSAFLLTFSVSLNAQVIPKSDSTRPALPEIENNAEDEPFALPEVEEAISGNLSSGIHFLLKNVNLSGNTAIPYEALAQHISPFLNRDVSMGDLENIRVAITKHYIDEGYINSGALLPDQEINNGSVTFQIIEGRLADIVIVGNDGLNQDYLRDRLMLENGRVFNLERFQERYQLLLHDPLIQRLNGQFQATPNLGESKLLLDVTRSQPYSLSAQLDNFGSPSSGEPQGSLKGAVHNLTGFGDVLDIGFTAKEGAQSGNLTFSVPITAANDRIGVRIAANNGEIIEEQLEALDIRSKFRSAEVFFVHPFYETLTNNLQLLIEFSVRDNEGYLLDIPFSFALGEENGTSRVSALRIGLQGSSRSQHDAFSFLLRYSQGLSSFNATKRADGLPDSLFSALLAQFQYAFQLSESSQLFWRFDGQLANEGLLPLEQLAIGGANTVRGYRENEQVRDSGFMTSLQWQTQLWDEFDYSGRWGALDAYVFTDYGDGKYHSNITNNADALWSVGVGLTWQWSEALSLDISFGHAINEPASKTNEVLQDKGFHVRLTSEIL